MISDPGMTSALGLFVATKFEAEQSKLESAELYSLPTLCNARKHHPIASVWCIEFVSDVTFTSTISSLAISSIEREDSPRS